MRARAISYLILICGDNSMRCSVSFCSHESPDRPALESRRARAPPSRGEAVRSAHRPAPRSHCHRAAHRALPLATAAVSALRLLRRAPPAPLRRVPGPGAPRAAVASRVGVVRSLGYSTTEQSRGRKRESIYTGATTHGQPSPFDGLGQDASCCSDRLQEYTVVNRSAVRGMQQIHVRTK